VDWTSVALRAAGGDAEALEALVDGCYGTVRRYCVAMGGARDADDLAQITFERAFRALPGFRGESSATTWLIGIARHVCIDHQRSEQRARRRHERSHSPTRHEPDPADAVALADLLERLRPDRREALLLTQVLGLSYAEAAAVCGCPVGTIRSRVARARADLLGGDADLSVAGQ